MGIKFIEVLAENIRLRVFASLIAFIKTKAEHRSYERQESFGETGIFTDLVQNRKPR